MTPANNNDMMQQVAAYRAKAADYEKLQQKINNLLSQHNHNTEAMSNASLNQYQTLARQRDETLNDLRWLEQQLLDDDIN
jgi:ElaB/YqjD/DUF883 family membrane-anchored ribosome-binding protein